jgi:hypothetical protein
MREGGPSKDLGKVERERSTHSFKIILVGKRALVIGGHLKDENRRVGDRNRMVER